MIRSMQRRLAVVVLLFLVAVYACLCAVSYGAAVSGMVRESEQMLRSLAEPDPPMGGRIFPGQVGVPYFTLLVDGRGVLEDADQGQVEGAGDPERPPAVVAFHRVPGCGTGLADEGDFTVGYSYEAQISIVIDFWEGHFGYGKLTW